MTTNDRLRTKVAALLEPDETIIAAMTLIGAPGDQPGAGVAEAARRHLGARGRYLDANQLDPTQGWQHTANDGVFVLTDRRALTCAVSLTGKPESIAWSASHSSDGVTEISANNVAFRVASKTNAMAGASFGISGIRFRWEGSAG